MQPSMSPAVAQRQPALVFLLGLVQRRSACAASSRSCRRRRRDRPRRSASRRRARRRRGCLMSSSTMLRSTSTLSVAAWRRRPAATLELAQDAFEIDRVRAQLEVMLLGGLRRARLRGGRRVRRASSAGGRRSSGSPAPPLSSARAPASGGGVVERDRRRQVGAHERRLAAQPLGDERVGIGLAQQHERAPEPLDVRRSHGSRATRSSAMNRASVAAPAAM